MDIVNTNKSEIDKLNKIYELEKDISNEKLKLKIINDVCDLEKERKFLEEKLCFISLKTDFPQMMLRLNSPQTIQ